MTLSLRYADTLIQLRGEALSNGQEFLTWNDVQKCIDTVNVQVHEEHERKKVMLLCAPIMAIHFTSFAFYPFTDIFF